MGSRLNLVKEIMELVIVLMAQMSYLALANDGILDLLEKATSKEVIPNWSIERN